jgi:hypothetical protein
MSNAKHTAGPWRYNPDSGRVEAGREILIANIRAHTFDVGIANARLIAAAPELLEALEMVRDADEDCHKDGLSTIPVIARAKIDAAIAKAAVKDAA